MKQFSRNQKRLFILIVVLLVLTGCATDRPDGTDANAYYTLSTTFGEVWSVSKFRALLVLPITYIINYVIEVLGWGIISGVGIATIIVNLVTMPIMIYSQKNSTKMQLLQPKINAIEKKYENRKDQQSLMMKTQETQKLYKDNDIKMGMTLLGSFIPLPLLMAMLNAVYYAGSLYNESNLFMGANLNLKPFDGFKNGPNGWIYIVIIILMVGTQFLSMKLPQFLNKKRLESDRSYKSYDKAQTGAKDPMAGMTNVMMVMMVWIALSTPTTMSVYYVFSSLMAIFRAFLGDFMVHKDAEAEKKDRKYKR